MTVNTTGRWAELWVRRDVSAAYDSQRSVLARVDELAATDTLAAVDVADCSKSAAAREPASRSAALAAFETFEDWAERTGVDLGPAFDRRSRSSLLSGYSHEVVVFPVLCLALYEANNLQGVFPCVHGQDVYTVQDCLDALEAGRIEELLAELGTDPEPADPVPKLA